MTHWDRNSKIAHDFSFGCVNFESYYVRNLSGYVLKAAAYMHLKLGAERDKVKKISKRTVS